MRTFLALGCYLIAKGVLLVGRRWIALAQRIEPMPPQSFVRDPNMQYAEYGRSTTVSTDIRWDEAECAYELNVGGTVWHVAPWDGRTQ